MRATVVAAGVALAAAAAGVGVFAWRLRPVEPARQTAAAPPVPAELTLPALLRAASVELVAAPVEGRIEQWQIAVGDEIAEGQLLVVIRSEALSAARDRSLADLERAQSRVNTLEAALTAARLEASRAGAEASRARSEFDRLERVWQRQKMLLTHGATPRLHAEKAEREYIAARTNSEGLDTLAKNAESRVAQLQADLDAARRPLEEKRLALEEAQAEVAAGEVLAPVTGVLVTRRGEAGDEVNPTMADLAGIATDLSRMQAVVELPPHVSDRVRAGDAASVSVAEAAAPLPATVESVEDGRAVLAFASPSPAIRPGMPATVTLRVGR